MFPRARLLPWLTAALLLLFAFQTLRLAWLSDDAYITLRSVENFTHGYGPVYNPGERVQAFTHPLWMLLLSAVQLPAGALGIPLPYTTLALSLAAALGAAAVLVFRAARSRPAALTALALLLCCKAVLDYSTSGLEDALSTLLLAVFAARLFADRPAGLGELSLWAALGMLNRLDLALVYAPTLLLLFWQLPPAERWRRGLLPALAGFLPLLLWEAFSLFYYGFPFPNTAYAKLSTGIPRALLLRQGGLYFADSLVRDPAGWLLLAASTALVFLRRSPEQKLHGALLLGVGLYLGYILSVGGDFMTGRFFALPFFAAALLLARLELHSAGRLVLCGAAVLLAFGLGANPWATLPPDQARQMPDSGIVDERAWYFDEMGLWNSLRSGAGLPLAPPWQRDPAAFAVLELDTIGVGGYRAGPSVHVVDRWALADPLLARLPVDDPLQWRIGHFRRELPAGYLETLQSGVNVILNPEIARYYERIRQVTRGPLYSPGRWAQAVRLALSQP